MKLTRTSLALVIGLALAPMAYADTKTDPTAEQMSEQVAAEFDTLKALLLIEEQANLKAEGKPTDYSEAIDKLTSSANHNSAVAQYVLGHAYIDGEQGALQFKHDINKALHWLKKSSELDYSEAQLTLGQMYFKGDAVPANYKISFAYFKKAALNNHPRAQVVLASFYKNGIGTTRNLVEAYAWNSVAAANNTDTTLTVQSGEKLQTAAATKRDEIAGMLLNSGSLDKAQTLAQTHLDEIIEHAKSE